MPKISIILPIFKTEDWLCEAIDSIRSQSAGDFELILVNDGSPGRARAICADYQKCDTRIKYIEQANAGVSAARNAGLALASGDYVFLMDSDDTIDPDFIKTSLDVAQSGHSDIVIVGKYFSNRPAREIAALPTCALLARHAFLKDHPDVRYIPGIQPAEDGIFSHMLLFFAGKISFNPRGIYHYRRREGQNSKAVNKQCQKLLDQIPIWFAALASFYKTHDASGRSRIHLARFVEHEPFEMRYLRMPFDKGQRKHLHGLINAFMRKEVLPFLGSAEYQSLSRRFRACLSTNNIFFLDILLGAMSIGARLLIFPIGLVPVGSLRRRWRNALRQRL